MSFAVAAMAYDAFMGRFSTPLAVPFAALLSLQPGQRVLDVGCGPGALTGVLLDRVSPGLVTAVDPMPAFVEATAQRFVGVDARVSPAESLPFGDDTFDAAAAQLVVHFMDDPVAGLAEMARVTRAGGTVAACVWDNAGDGSPLATFWRAALELDPTARDESTLAGSTQAGLAGLLRKAGLIEVKPGQVEARVGFDSFDEWWAPYLLGVGPAGAYVAGLADDRRASLADRCAELFGPAPFTVTARAWSAIGRVA